MKKGRKEGNTKEGVEGSGSGCAIHTHTEGWFSFCFSSRGPLLLLFFGGGGGGIKGEGLLVVGECAVTSVRAECQQLQLLLLL